MVKFAVCSPVRKLLFSTHLLLFKGYYMYIEASSLQQRGGNAKFYSPPLTLLANMCLEFYYYMSGASIGSLNVTINKTVVFSASGDKGDVWNKASINISSIVGSQLVSINNNNNNNLPIYIARIYLILC